MQYQAEVRRRLKLRKREGESKQEQEVDFIASMLPTALDMHKFTRIMNKEVFERQNGYKVVTAIRKNKDKERLEYLLNNNLSAI